MSSCAACGRPLAHDLAECPDCNSGDRKPFFQPEFTKGAVSLLRLSIILAFLAVGVVVTIASRIREFKEALLPAILYVGGGLIIVIALAKLFASSTEQKL
jgi:hypothetical protein